MAVRVVRDSLLRTTVPCHQDLAQWNATVQMVRVSVAVGAFRVDAWVNPRPTHTLQSQHLPL